MLKFDPKLPLGNLPAEVYDALAAELNKNDSWKPLAQYVCRKLGYPSTWVKGLENKVVLNKTPGEKLLVELITRMCNVKIFCVLLDNCNLYDSLSILHSPELLDIDVHPDDNKNFDDLEMTLGTRLQLTCKAHGMPPPKYQWYHEDVRLEGQTSEELDISITSASQKGTYKCQVYQVSYDDEMLCDVFSRSIFIDIRPTAISIEKHPEPFSEVKEGCGFSLLCEATSYPRPKFQWFKNNVKLSNQTSNLLQIEKFTVKDEGKYYCHISNDYNEVSTKTSSVMMEQPRQKAVAKVALLIANESYDNQETLRTPRNDVALVAKILKGLGFHTICLADLTLIQMKNAIEIFCDSLIEGTYGLFYFAGHGFKMQENYMLSIDTPKDYLRKDAICESQLLSMALKNEPALLVVVLDMCQTVPPMECNPKIHEEIPSINEYKGKKNLRNLLQAYSTSSYRPSYERLGKDYGLYATHLCKYLDENIPITKVFEQVGKSIDTSLKGAERKQIPMFATTVTKPYRFTDTTFQGKKLPSIENLEKLIAFPSKIIDINFQQIKVNCKVMISQYMKPYLNFVQISLFEIDEKWETNFYNSVHTKRNNLFQCTSKRKCWLHNPQCNEGPLLISLLENGTYVGATLLQVNEFVPALLNRLNVQ